MNLEFVKDTAHTLVFSDYSEQEITAFETKNMTANYHSFAISPELFEQDQGLRYFWDVTSISYMPDGRAFVASIEAKDYPFFATQFHPEKPNSIFFDNVGLNHSWESIQTLQGFSKLMLRMSRNNLNSFGNYFETQPYLISNYDLINTRTKFDDVYVF